MALGALGGFSGCSFVIDVPADCRDTDCAPYVCGADGVACQVACDADTECVSGFVCDIAIGACEPAGCEPVGPAISMRDLPTQVDEVDVVAPRSPEQLIVMLANQNGLGLLRFNMLGERVPDAFDETLGALRLAPANADRSPFEPFARRVLGASGEEEVLFAWRTNVDNLDRVDFARFAPNENRAPEGGNAFTARQRTLLDVPHLSRDAVGLRAFWRESVSQSSALQTVSVAQAGADARTLTLEGESVGDLSVAPLAERSIVVAPVSSDGLERLELFVVDENGVLVGLGRLVAEQPAQSVAFPLIALDVEEQRLLALFGVATTETEYRVALMTASEAAGLAADAATPVSSFLVGRGLSDVRTANATWRGGEVFLAWDAVYQDRRDVWVTRYTAEGAARFAPFPVGLAGGSNVDSLHVFPSNAGVDVVWREPSDSGDAIVLQRFACLP
jgi:hypothetical protein